MLLFKIRQCARPVAAAFQCMQPILPELSSLNALSRIQRIDMQTTYQFRRGAHSDIKIPDFDSYRRESNKNPTKNSTDANDRIAFTYLICLGGAIPATYGAKGMVNMFVMSMAASPAALAIGGPVEIKVTEVPEGKCFTFVWRKKPLFVRHLTAQEIETERETDVSGLRDPEVSEQRCARPDFLICIGICTHLGCVPIANKGEYGGYFCPCHGSHYDALGRIRKGPAPKNLEVPPVNFIDDATVIVG